MLDQYKLVRGYGSFNPTFFPNLLPGGFLFCKKVGRVRLDSINRVAIAVGLKLTIGRLLLARPLPPLRVSGDACA